MDTVSRWVVGADLHFPKYDEATFNIMLEVIRDIQPKGFIFQGDQHDNQEISHHTKGQPYYRDTGSYKRNTEQFEHKILTPLEKALPNKCEKVWIVGNHDYWEFELVEEQPELEGMLDRPSIYKLLDRGWEIIPLGMAKYIGELKVIHGEGISGMGMYPAKRAVEDNACCVLAAHSHAPQSYTKLLPGDQRKKWMGHVAPILGHTNPFYLRNRPTAWLQGFTIVEIWEKGYFNLYTVIVTEGRCAYGGRLYGRS